MKKTPLLVLAIILIGLVGWFAYFEYSKPKLIHISGQTMGSIVYNVKYLGVDRDYSAMIDNELDQLNQSLSTYITNSEISILNEEGEFEFKSTYFYPVLEKSRSVYDATAGAFDPSIGPVVQAWGFGPDKKVPELDSTQVDSLMDLTGFAKVVFTRESVTIPNNFQLDFSAIAKGYAVDLVAEVLEQQGIVNYMVEIGGEVRCKGRNEKTETWKLGIEDPLAESMSREIIAITTLKDRSLATSGNYRNYYEKDGKIYAHIIDPRTGYTSSHNLLSASVFAEDCMTADAYATAFMVLGEKESKDILKNDNQLDAILIYRDRNNELEYFASNGIKNFVKFK